MTHILALPYNLTAQVYAITAEQSAEQIVECLQLPDDRWVAFNLAEHPGGDVLTAAFGIKVAADGSKTVTFDLEAAKRMAEHRVKEEGQRKLHQLLDGLTTEQVTAHATLERSKRHPRVQGVLDRLNEATAKQMARLEQATAAQTPEELAALLTPEVPAA